MKKVYFAKYSESQFTYVVLALNLQEATEKAAKAQFGELTSIHVGNDGKQNELVGLS